MKLSRLCLASACVLSACAGDPDAAANEAEGKGISLSIGGSSSMTREQDQRAEEIYLRLKGPPEERSPQR